MLGFSLLYVAMLSQVDYPSLPAIEYVDKKKSTYAWMWIHYDNAKFPVWGYKLATGTIVWDSSLPENIEQYDKAKKKSGSSGGQGGTGAPSGGQGGTGAPSGGQGGTGGKGGDAGPSGGTGGTGGTGGPGGPSSGSGGTSSSGAPMNFGVDPTKLGKIDNHYQFSGDEAKHLMQRVIEAESLNGRQMFVTVIGTDPEKRKQVVEDIATSKSFDDLRSQLIVQEFSPKEWQVDPLLGFMDGNPAIYIQSSKGSLDPKGGRVLFHAYDYSIGPEGLAQAIRKADPNYKPTKDPGPLADDRMPGLMGFSQREVVFGCLALIFVLVILPSKKR